MKANMGTTALYNGIKNYYARNRYIGSGIGINVTYYLANDTETTNKTESVKSVFHIRVKKLIKSTSASSITVVPITTKATITIDLPKDVQKSSTPLGGWYKIKCIDPEGYVSYS